MNNSATVLFLYTYEFDIEYSLQDFLDGSRRIEELKKGMDSLILDVSTEFLDYLLKTELDKETGHIPENAVESFLQSK